MTYQVPRGWTRGDEIVVNTAPSPWLRDRDLVVVTLAHDRGGDIGACLRFTDADGFEEWRRWWFDVPKPPFPIDLLAEARKQFTDEQWGKLRPPAPKPHVVIESTLPPARKNPFAQPVNNVVKNPFASKPKSPFDKA